MRVVSSLPTLRPASSMSSYQLSACLRVRILNFAGVCARGDFCDVFGAEAGCSQVRCCATSLCSILCWCQDIIPRECQALCTELSVLPQIEGASCEDRGCKKMVFPAAMREKSQRWVALSCDAHLVFAC